MVLAVLLCPSFRVWLLGALLALLTITPVQAQGDGPADGVAVVLGFANLSREPELEWINIGIREAVSAGLTARGFVVPPDETVNRVIAELSASLGDADLEANPIGAALGAAWVVYGSYRRLGPTLQLTAYLHDVQTETTSTLQAERSRIELFELQDDIVSMLETRMRRQAGAPVSVNMDSRRVGATATTVRNTSGGGFRVPATTTIIGPPPPEPPAVVARDQQGRATLRAVRVSGDLTIDGALDEAVYQATPAVSGFIQQQPVEGAPATERTEFWVLFDDDALYISARCWDSAPPSRWVANEMRRDSFNVGQGDYVALLLDTFYDRRSGNLFTVNPIGGRMDGQLTDERSYNGDWNPIWDVRTGRFEGGWTFEAAIPFKSLRYRAGQTQIWGFNILRNVRWKNENSFVVPMPAARGPGAMQQASLAATLVGLEVPADGRTLEIKPYVVADLTTNRRIDPAVSNDVDGDVGLDVKYTVTQNLVADLTVNTDFAQVEADEQQINLTRFSLFFPEKREFFLENQGVFAFGGAGAGPFGGGGNTPLLFYSRRIGLNGNQEVPIEAGGRLTGRVGAFSIGVMNIQTGEERVAGAPRTNFSVLRLRRDLLRRSSIGILATNRSVSTRGAGSNQAYGVDGLFSFYDNLDINTYWARTQTPGESSDDVSYRVELDYGGDRFGVGLEHLAVGRGFNPEVGFLRREDFERSFASFRFSPRPRGIAAIRQFTWEGQVDYITDRADVLETRELQGRFGIELENGDQFNTRYTRTLEFLDRPFPIARDVTIPVGSYRFADVQLSYAFGPQRWFAGNFSAQHGSFFEGEKTTIAFSRGRIELTPRFSFEPGLSFNRVDLPQGRFTAKLVTTRTTFTVTPLMFVSALLQYNSSANAVSANVRLRWEYQPGSELFVVFDEARDTLSPHFPGLQNRAVVVKVNRLFRF